MARSGESPARKAWPPVLATAVTCAPRPSRSCTAKEPTPPAAPTTSTRWPAASPASRSACTAVIPAPGSEAPSAKESEGGFAVASASVAHTRSAIAALRESTGFTMPTTASPGFRRATASPTDSTTPA